LVKPFDIEELAARIRALCRRSVETKPAILTYGKLQLDPANNEVNYDGQVLILTTKEYMILELLMRHCDRTFSRSAILDKLWEIDKVINSGEQTIRTHITNLRHKLKDAGMREDCIETICGVGYRLRS